MSEGLSGEEDGWKAEVGDGGGGGSGSGQSASTRSAEELA